MWGSDCISLDESGVYCVGRERAFRILDRIWAAAAVGALALALGGCGQRREVQAERPKEPEIKMAPATPIDTKRAELGGDKWDPEWDVVVEKALPGDLLSARVNRDVRPFCPRFGQMKEADKRAFWAYFFQALAGAEAGLKPTTNVRHAEPEVAVKDDVTKRMVRSEGLLQLTYMDAERYGCDFDWDADKKLAEKDPAKTILQPDRNLTSQGRPLLSRASYWSTLRPGMASYQVFLKQMTSVPLACRVDRDVRLAGSKPAAGNTVVSK